MQSSEVFVPITMFIVSGFVIIAAIYIGFKKRQLQSEEIRAAIEKGVDVPFPEIPRKRYLMPGTIWTLIGIVSTLAMAFSLPDEAPAGVWLWGLLPVAVGAGYLVVHFSEEKEKA